VGSVLKNKKMRLYKREGFIKLPNNTIYSRVTKGSPSLMDGLFCKVEGNEVDWFEQDLISESGFPNGINDSMDAHDYVMNLRDTFQDFETDLECSGRDGMFDDEDLFVVWNRKDVFKLINYLLKTVTE
jgi:hypothetical protein